MKNLIERQDAIDALRGLTHRFEDPEDWCILEGEAEFVLSKLPSAQPEREKGNWVYGEDEYEYGIDGYHCDKCGFFVPWDYGHAFINYIEDYNFCPNCGADMREETS